MQCTRKPKQKHNYVEKIKLTIVNSTKQKISQILWGEMTYTLYTHSDEVLVWNTSVLHNHVFVTLYTCILSNFKVLVHKFIDSILLFLGGKLHMYASLSGTVYNTPFNMIVLKMKLWIFLFKRDRPSVLT